MPETPAACKQEKQKELFSPSWASSPRWSCALSYNTGQASSTNLPLWLTSPLPALLEPPCLDKHPNNLPLHLTRVTEALPWQERRLLERAELCEEHSAELPATACQGRRGWGRASSSSSCLQQKPVNYLLITVFQSWESRILESWSVH